LKRPEHRVAGSGIEHIGSEMESVEKVKKELAALREPDAEMRERIVRVRDELETPARFDCFVSLWAPQFSDPDGGLSISRRDSLENNRKTTLSLPMWDRNLPRLEKGSEASYTRPHRWNA
jgi:hypothetical protein